MRLCRVEIDGTPLAAFYLDDCVIPFDIAADAAGIEADDVGDDDLLAYLPPYGALHGAARAVHEWLAVLSSDTRSELGIPMAEARLLVPVARPPKLLLLAGNYPKHVKERGGIAAEREATFPYIFMKPPSTTLNPPGGPVVIPAISPDAIDWECELGVVIGRGGKRIAESDALGHVAGYTVINDISDRRFRPNPGRTARPRDEHFDWLHGKWHDGSCPMGPCIRADDGSFDPQNLALKLEVNGRIMQDANTDQMVFPIAAVVAFISSFVTLEPGDVIATGTPAGVGAAHGVFLKPGDLVRATIEGIGSLSNPVIAEGVSGG